MKEFLQNIFIFISEKELILPFYMTIMMSSILRGFCSFMKLGQYSGNPMARTIALTHFTINFLLFIESVIFSILNLLKIKEIMIFKISLIIYLITVWYPYFKLNIKYYFKLNIKSILNEIKESIIRPIEDISTFFIYFLESKNLIKNKNLEKKRNLEIKEIIKDTENKLDKTKRD